MSTNYYIGHRKALASGDIPQEWIKLVHIAQYTANGFLLQAIRGATDFATDNARTVISRENNKNAFYWSPVGGFDTVENWEQMKAVIFNPEFAIIDEYGIEVKTKDFVEMVENQKDGADSRYHHMTRWLSREPSRAYFRASFRSDYLDKDGYSFEIREFS